ncbi:MAG: outer membrane beta-barrel protein [Candidatus Omnitrophota bacterium]|nr:MAG: outer membrane beta-barrel protein [Candidatus Omnitrophota bacterium]
MKLKKVLIILIISCIGFSCYAQVSRRDVISLTLDYYELKQKAATKKEKLEEKRERIEKEKREVVGGEKWERMKALFKKYFRENLKLFAELSLEYNDNIYRTHTDETSDFITRFSAGANFIPKVTEEVAKTGIFFSLRGDALGYSSESSESTGNLYSKVGLTHRFTKIHGITFDFGADKILATASEITGTGVVGELVDHWRISYGAKLDSAVGRFPWDASYRLEENRFEGKFDYSDYDKEVVSFTGYIPLRGKRNLFAEYEMGDVEYPNRLNAGWDYDKFWLGARGKIFRKFDGLIKFGWGNYEFANGREKDTEDWRAELGYTPRKNFILRFAGGQSIEPTTYTGDDHSKQTDLEFSCRYLPPKLKKVILGAGISWTNYDFDTGREDDLWQYYARGDYKMNKWFRIALRYEHNSRDSNIPIREYEQNIVSLILRGDF